MSAHGDPTIVMLRCQNDHCGEYARFNVPTDEVLRSDASSDLSPAFWRGARCQACGGDAWEGVLLHTVPERRSFRARARVGLAGAAS